MGNSSSTGNPFESINCSIEEADPNAQTDLLIEVIEFQVKKINGQEKASASFTSQAKSVASITNMAAKFIETISNQATKIKDTEILQEMGSVALNAVKAISETHWIFLGLSVAACALDRYVNMKSSPSECKELLEKIVDLLREVKKMKKTMPEYNEKLCNAVQVIVKGVVLCCHHMAKPDIIRYFSMTTARDQFVKTGESIKEIQMSLILAGVTHNASQFNKLPVVSPIKLLEIIPEGRKDQEQAVMEMLAMEGSDPVVAVVLCGFGGVGKSTLALSVIQQLNWASTPFKFCRVIIDEKTPDMMAHIVKLQKDIIRTFTEEKLDLGNPDDGRHEVQKALANKSCFLFIDNVADIDYVRKLLPRELSPGEQSEEQVLSLAQLKTKSKLRILITSRESNLRQVLNIKQYKEYRVDSLSLDAAKTILRKEILQDESQVHDEFDEAGLIDKVAEACRGVPLLLSRIGNHLRFEREEGSYYSALKSLQEVDLGGFSIGTEDSLSKTLFFLYDAMKGKQPQAQEAFLDICTYFHGWEWDVVGHIVGKAQLETLHRKMLVTRGDSDTATVHDILRVMGIKEAKGTRITNDKELSDILESKSKLETVRGVVLGDRSFTRLETRHLNAMNSSLRVLHLGDCVEVNGPPCDKVFRNLRYFRLGDVAEFPFQAASKLNKLSVFWNASKSAMNLGQLPLSLKLIHYQVADCNEFQQLPLQNLRFLEWFRVKTQEPVTLPQVFKLPSSLKILDLSSCKQVPERLSHLTALEKLFLNKCDFQVSPQGFGQLDKLKYLSMEYCTNLTSLSEAVGSSICLLTYLSVRGCTLLQKLPDNLGKLSKLQELNIRDCKNLTALPYDLTGLSSLQNIDLTGCIKLQRLPGSFATLSLRSLTLESLIGLEGLPPNFGDLAFLMSLTLKSCKSLTSLPDSFVQLEMLETLRLEKCINLDALPKGFGRLRSLKEMIVEDCQSLKELPSGFQSLPTLKILTLTNCSSLENLPAGFGELSCMEELRLMGLVLSRLPDGFGGLKSLKVLWILNCSRLATLPDDFENLVCMRKVKFRFCPALEATAMERIVRLQHCFLLDIEGSEKMVERWKEMKQEEERYYPMVVITSSLVDNQEWQRVATVSLFRGQCIELNSSGDEVIEHPSMLVDNGKTIVVVLLPVRIDDLNQLLFQILVETAKERASSEQLQFICLRKVEIDVHEREGVGGGGEECIRKILAWLPEGSRALPSTDTRRLLLIQYVFFHLCNYLDDDKICCFLANMQADDNDNQCFAFPQIIGEGEISKMFLDKLSTSSDKSGDEIGEIRRFLSEVIPVSDEEGEDDKPFISKKVRPRTYKRRAIPVRHTEAESEDDKRFNSKKVTPSVCNRRAIPSKAMRKLRTTSARK